MTIKELFDYVDEIRPNSYGNQTKMVWVNEIEGAVQTEIMGIYPADVASYEGDADLDGFRIAKEVGNCIRLKKVVASDVLKKASSDEGRELSPEQIKRTSAFLFNPKYRDYEFADEVRSILVRGKWIEQESFAGVLNGRGGKRGEK